MTGNLELAEMHSPSLEGNLLGDSAKRPILIYRPRGPSGPLPAAYFLHGFTGSARGWANAQAFSPNVPERIDALVSSGALPPFIAVFIDGWTSMGGTQWDNSETLGPYRDYVVRDVVPWIESRFQTIARRESRLVIGKSSGGYGAMVMARHHADVFAHACCHSGDSAFELCYLGDFPKAADAILEAGGVEQAFQALVRRATQTKMRGDDHALLNTVAMAAAYSPRRGAPLHVDLPFEPETCRLRDDIWAKWLALDPVRFIPRSAAAFQSMKSVFIDCGTRDEANLRWGARQMAAELRRLGVDVVHEEFPDGHMNINYRYDRSLRYLIPRLSR